jgi:molecular chaperone HscB
MCPRAGAFAAALMAEPRNPIAMDPFATLGLPRRYEIDLERLEANYRELQRALHPDRHAGASASQRRMSMLKAVEVNDAYRALKDELRRADALLALYDGSSGEKKEHPPEDPEFLMEMLELREALSEAKESNHAARVRELHAQVQGMDHKAHQALALTFGTFSEAPTAAELDAVRRLIGRLKYYRRFLDEVNALHEEGGG